MKLFPFLSCSFILIQVELMILQWVFTTFTGDPKGPKSGARPFGRCCIRDWNTWKRWSKRCVAMTLRGRMRWPHSTDTIDSYGKMLDSNEKNAGFSEVFDVWSFFGDDIFLLTKRELYQFWDDELTPGIIRLSWHRSTRFEVCGIGHPLIKNRYNMLKSQRISTTAFNICVCQFVLRDPHIKCRWTDVFQTS